MEANHTIPFSIKLKHVFWIAGIFICIWFSGCSHRVPDGYTLICNQFGEYSVSKDKWQPSGTFKTRQEAIEYAIAWDSLQFPDWSECEGE